MRVNSLDVSMCTEHDAILNMDTVSGTPSHLVNSTSTYVISQEVLCEFLNDPGAEHRPKVDVVDSGIDEDDIEESEHYETERIEHRKASRLEGFF